MFRKKEEQSFEADDGPGLAPLAMTALRQLSRAQVGLTSAAAKEATAIRRMKKRIMVGLIRYLSENKNV